MTKADKLNELEHVIYEAEVLAMTPTTKEAAELLVQALAKGPDDVREAVYLGLRRVREARYDARYGATRRGAR